MDTRKARRTAPLTTGADHEQRDSRAQQAAASAADLSVELGRIWSELGNIGLRNESDEWRAKWNANHRLIDELESLIVFMQELASEKA